VLARSRCPACARSRAKACHLGSSRWRSRVDWARQKSAMGGVLRQRFFGNFDPGVTDGRQWRYPFHAPVGQQLVQCLDRRRVLLAQSRANGEEALMHVTPGDGRHVRVHRMPLQSDPASLDPGVSSEQIPRSSRPLFRDEAGRDSDMMPAALARDWGACLTGTPLCSRQDAAG
jgi:hypothetical protein